MVFYRGIERGPMAKSKYGQHNTKLEPVWFHRSHNLVESNGKMMKTPVTLVKNTTGLSRQEYRKQLVELYRESKKNVK